MSTGEGTFTTGIADANPYNMYNFSGNNER